MINKSHLNITHFSPLPSPIELLSELPSTPKQREFVENSKKKIISSLNPASSKLLLIVGPCSVHDINATREYALKLKEFSKEVEETFFVIMRFYFEKPRTTLGWKGILYDPHLDNSNAMHTGLRITRKLLLEIADLGLPVASEFLDPLSCFYFGDLISWGCIGARTSESQIHREIASSLETPIAFKNSTRGNIEVAVHGVLAASQPHSYLGINEYGRVSLMHSKGNPNCHVALRGGEQGPNFDPESIGKTLNYLERVGLDPVVLVDCSHDNSRRKHAQQVNVFQALIHQIVEGAFGIRGMILESNLIEGNQSLGGDPSKLHYGISITDPCINWETTENLVRWGCEALAKGQKEIFSANKS